MRISVIAAIAVSFGLGAAPVRAQEVERAIPFDSAGRVMAITGPLVARLGLTAPHWPVAGDFTEARLYAADAGRHILAVERRAGFFERYSLNPDELAALRNAVNAAVSRVGLGSSDEREDVISESARGAFMRNQMILAFTVYGGSLAALAGEGEMSAALYLMAPAITFFSAGAYARTHHISASQNHLATDGALRFAVAAEMLMGAADVDQDEALAAGVLAGGIAGTVYGVARGRALTLAEASGSTWGSTTAAAVTLGGFGAAGAFHDDSDLWRAGLVSAVAAGAIGYPIGRRYVRRARYTVSSGDISALSLSGWLGAATALTPAVESEREGTLFALGTAGFVVGQLLGDHLLVRQYDFTRGEGRLLYVGALAGALMGGGFAVALQTNEGVAVAGLLTAGAIAGTALTSSLLQPRRSGERRPMRPSDGEAGLRLHLEPATLIAVAARQLTGSTRVHRRPETGDRPFVIPLARIGFR